MPLNNCQFSRLKSIAQITATCNVRITPKNFLGEENITSVFIGFGLSMQDDEHPVASKEWQEFQ